MKSEQDLLQKQYDATINQTDPWYFFLNLSDYVKFVNKTHPFKEIVEPLKQQKEDLLLELDKYEEKAVEELLLAKKKLEKLVSKVAGLPEKLKKVGFFSDGFTSIDQYLEGRISTSGTKSDVISRYLYEVSWDITEQGQVDILDDYTVSPEGRPRIVQFSDSLKKRQELNENLNIQQQITPWGYWDFLDILSDKGVFVWSDWKSKYPNVDQNYLSELLSIKQELQENKPSDNTFPRIQKSNRTSTRESRVPTYKHYLERIHLYLLKEANNFQNKSSKSDVSLNLDTAVLIINGQKVELRKTSKQFELMRVIFTDKEKDWQLSEVAEQMDKYNEKWKNLYNLVNAIENKISTETGIKDFFQTTTQSVKINKNYLR